MKLLDRHGLRDGGDELLAILGEGPAVTVAPSTPPAAILALIDTLDLVVVDFPGFADGRGFSIARTLRQAGYRGRLRAAGALIPDQFAFALQCGFDELALSEERLARQPVAQWLAALDAIGESYQPTTRIIDIFAQRRAARTGVPA